MSIIDEKKIKELLCLAQEIKNEHAYYDIHVHPLDIFSEFVGKPINVTEKKQMYTDYQPPKIVAIKDEGNFSNVTDRVMNLCKSFVIKKRYARADKQLLIDHMELSLIDKMYLLPVPSKNGRIIDQLEYLSLFYKNEERIQCGGSISNDVKISDIMAFMTFIKKRFNIKTIKIHPNITCINTTLAAGKERIEAILSACSELHLPAIIHGGRSAMLADKTQQDYGTIENLKDINWGISKKKVVIAHAFCHDYDALHVKKHIITKLRNLCDKYDNIIFDLSNLNFDSMIYIIDNIDNNRIVFGSDALYEHQWAAVAKLLVCLSRSTKNIEDSFMKIISLNPKKYLFKEDTNLSECKSMDEKEKRNYA